MSFTTKIFVSVLFGIILAIVACDGGYESSDFTQLTESSTLIVSADVRETGSVDTLAPRVNTYTPKVETAKGYMTEPELDHRVNLPVPFQHEADPPWSFVPIDHKSVCGADGQECTPETAHLCPHSDNACEFSGCQFGCCATAPVEWNCCNTDNDCGPNSACINNVCEDQESACKPDLIPNVPVGCVAEVRLSLHHCYFLAWETPDCNLQRPTECHVSEDCWPDSTCNSDYSCEKLTCFGKFDEGCYEPGSGPVALDWKCRANLYSPGTPCDDGDPVTTSDTCHAGKCLGISLAIPDSP